MGAEKLTPGLEVQIDHPNLPRHGLFGEVLGIRDTVVGPLVEVAFEGGERGLYEHEVLRPVLPGRKGRRDGRKR